MNGIGVALVLSICSVAASAAMIVPTGGALEFNPVGTPAQTSVAVQYGDFDAVSSVDMVLQPGESPTSVVLVTMSGNYSQTSLHLNPTANHAFSILGPSYFGSVSGTVGFDLTESSLLG